MRFEKRPALIVLGVAAILAVIATALADEFTAKVVGIDDGDAIDVRAEGNVQYRIRLAGIDAPEHGQAYGNVSQKHLGDLVFGKQVTLDCGKEESYGRKVCKVLLANGEDVDLDQVKAGLAWHYKQYAFEQTPEERWAYAAAEDAAREAHLGLWADAHPIRPQDFRHGTQSELCFPPGDHRIACSEQYREPARGKTAQPHLPLARLSELRRYYGVQPPRVSERGGSRGGRLIGQRETAREWA